jgi:hypothetical protein
MAPPDMPFALACSLVLFWAAKLLVLAAPRFLGIRPSTFPIVMSLALELHWRRCHRATLPCVPAAPILLAFGPPGLPHAPVRLAIEGCHRRRRGGLRRGGRAADFELFAAPRPLHSVCGLSGAYVVTARVARSGGRCGGGPRSGGGRGCGRRGGGGAPGAQSCRTM